MTTQVSKKKANLFKSKVCQGTHTKKPNVCESRGEAGERYFNLFTRLLEKSPSLRRSANLNKSHVNIADKREIMAGHTCFTRSRPFNRIGSIYFDLLSSSSVSSSPSSPKSKSARRRVKVIEVECCRNHHACNLKCLFILRIFRDDEGEIACTKVLAERSNRISMHLQKRLEEASVKRPM